VIGCITTKLDEAANLGAVLDVVMRHRLVMYFMADGQRVPEDLHPINLDLMLNKAFKPADLKTPFTMDEQDFPMMMSAEVDGTDEGEVTYAL
jgi:flagellar biosynthesis protein FlhF